MLVFILIKCYHRLLARTRLSIFMKPADISDILANDAPSAFSVGSSVGCCMSRLSYLTNSYDPTLHYKFKMYFSDNNNHVTVLMTMEYQILCFHCSPNELKLLNKRLGWSVVTPGPLQTGNSIDELLLPI